MKRILLTRLLTCLMLSLIAPYNFSSAEQNKEEKLETPEETVTPKGLLIFLDDEERSGGIGPVGYSLDTAIFQKAGPILASASLLVSQSFSSLNSDEWIIKQVNKFLFLCIPHSYLKDLNIDTNLAKADDAKEVSATELRLGLKVNHMKTVYLKEVFYKMAWKDQQDLLKKIPPLKDFRANKYADYFTNSLNEIFCTNTEYQEKKYSNRPVWSIYMMGHGQFKSRIIALRLNDFKETVLPFFAKKIMARALIYISCYAAGENTEIIYKDNTSKLQSTYPFTIITLALTAEVIKANMGGDTEKQNFIKFFQEVTKEIIDFKQAVNYVGKGFLTYNFEPQIKLPGTEWFSVMNFDKKCFSIGEILSKTRDPEKPLDLGQMTKNQGSNPIFILLYAKNIPFELIINREIDSIISMVPGNALHTINKISSSNFTTNTILAWFLNRSRDNSDESESEKSVYFCINEINGSNGTIYDVICSFYWGRMFAYYFSAPGKSSKNLFRKEPNKPGKEAPEKFSDYKKILDTLTLEQKEGKFAEGSLLPSSITSEGIKNIKDVLEKRKKISQHIEKKEKVTSEQEAKSVDEKKEEEQS